jgi:hypothetical protein
MLIGVIPGPSAEALSMKCLVLESEFFVAGIVPLLTKIPFLDVLLPLDLSSLVTDGRVVPKADFNNHAFIKKWRKYEKLLRCYYKC